MKTLFLGLLALAVCWPANSQSNLETALVSSKDVLQQMDAVIFADSMNKKPPEQTLATLKALVKLNELQISLADVKNHENGKPNPLGSAADYSQTFYDLRAVICKQYRGMVVDLDGTVRHCN